MRKTGGGIKGGYCSMSNYKKGMELIVKGDGSLFDHILWTAFDAALSSLCCLVFQPYTAATYG